jgi:Uma2 family endonuclease
MVSTVPERLRRHRLKVSEYLRMGEAGILPTDARVELIEIIDMAPINSPHSGTVIQLTQWLSMRVGERVLVSVQNPIVLGTYSAPQPDIALLRPREDFYTTVHPGPEDVLLVIEVADTTLRDDREVKVPLYGAHGIPEVWLIDVESKAVQVFRAFEGGQYRNVFTARGTELLAPVLLADVRIDVSQLL